MEVVVWKLLMAASLAVIFLTGYQIMDCEWVCCAIVLQGHSYSPLPSHFAYAIVQIART
jgi:hypothetical protein